MSTPRILDAADPDAIERAALELAAGGLVGLPTETVYGIAVLPRREPLEALIAAKRRPPGKGVALLLDGLDQVAGLVLVPGSAGRLAERFWPGPLTLVLPLRPGADVPSALTGGGPALGVRVPDHPVPRALARSLGPIAVSSANLSGEAEATTAVALVEALGSSLSLVLDGGAITDGGVPSSVVVVAADGSLDVRRVGAIPPEAIERAALELT